MAKDKRLKLKVSKCENLSPLIILCFLFGSTILTEKTHLCSYLVFVLSREIHGFKGKTKIAKNRQAHKKMHSIELSIQH